MQVSVEAVQSKIEEISVDFGRLFPELTFRFACICYRGPIDDQSRTEFFDFTDDTDDTDDMKEFSAWLSCGPGRGRR
jgi:hypothetical protein